MKPPHPSSDWRAFKDKALQNALANLAKDDPEKHARVVADRPTVKQRYLIKREARAHRQHRIIELLLRGNTQADIAKVTGVAEPTISRVLAPIFPFPSPGRDNRYILSRLDPAKLRALDLLAELLLVDRMRALEMLIHANLESDAKVARRTLGIRGEQ
jgi:uncharacterized protein YerC